MTETQVWIFIENTGMTPYRNPSLNPYRNTCLDFFSNTCLNPNKKPVWFLIETIWIDIETPFWNL